LDFKKDYYFEKFTKKGIQLYWINGTDHVRVIARVEFRKEYEEYSLYTEGWEFIEHFKLPTEADEINDEDL
jgi:Uma2 family endonuclease